MGNAQQRKDWRRPLVVYRYTMYLSWGNISRRIRDKLRRDVVVVPLAADRAIVWCTDEDEVSSLTLNPIQFSKGRDQVKIKRWNMFAHWDNLQIHVNHSWIGIEGLPLNMWNIHVFKIIGKSLGGLLDVAPETTSLSFLKFAKIKVGGLEDGFVDPILEILCQGLRVSLGIFAISNPMKYSEGRSTLGLITRVVRAEEGWYGDGGRDKQQRTGQANILQTMKPLFFQRDTVQADVEAKTGKKLAAESYKQA